jgi:RNA polymerase sigma-70 factor (ECF subfamily)
MAARSAGTLVGEWPVIKVRETFEQFYGRQYRPVLALAYVLSGSQFLAEELTQEAFVAAFRQWDAIENPEGWVRTVVSNRARSWLRHRYAENRAFTRLGVDPVSTVDELPADTAHFWEAVRSLPRRQAQTIALVYLDGNSISDTAGILGCSESVHLTRGRRSLAEHLGVEEGT